MANEFGLKGLVDFVGYPVGQGQPVNIPIAGFVGLLDFVGYPVAQGAVVRRGGGKGHGGRRLAMMMIAQSQSRRSVLDGLKTRHVRSAFDHLREDNERLFLEASRTLQRRKVVASTYTILLSEI